MLTLTRHTGESIELHHGGVVSRIHVTVVSSTTAKLHIDAPSDVYIKRGELTGNPSGDGAGGAA